MRRKYIFFMFLGLLFGTIMVIKATVLSETHNLKSNKDILGDMAFIKGDGNVRDFYIGVSEEPNINWKLYTSWLNRIFSMDFPEVYRNAQKRRDLDFEFYKFNDPYVLYYAEHPAFAYYPVTGVSWNQVQDYLSWKTDRVNEYILIENRMLYADPNQVNEENFTLESFLANQYEGAIRGLIEDKSNVYGMRKINWNDHVLLPGYRLPTEAEWEYANQSHFSKPFTGEKNSSYGSHPFGKEYFLLKWMNVEYGGNEHDYVVKIPDYSFYYNPELDNEKRICSVRSFSSKITGVCNMEGNVKEYLADYYSEDKNNISNWVDVYNVSGFPLDFILKDSTGNTMMKDEQGKMHYRILGENEDGTALMLGKDYLNRIENIVVKGGDWRNPGNIRMSFHPDSSSSNIGFRCVLSSTKTLR